jgi:hypothetical protein
MEKIDDEIVAVITAAITSNFRRPGTKLVVKSIKRAVNNTPVWNTTGRIERLSRRLNS